MFPRDLLPAAWGGPAARIAGPHAVRLAREVEAGGLADDGAAWLEDVPAAGRAALDLEAARLTEWLEGHRVSTVYPSPAMKAVRG